MSEKREKRRVELRIVDAPAEPEPDHDGDGDGGDHDGGGPGGGAPRRDRPAVNIVNGWRSQAIDEAEKHLVKIDHDLFQRDRMIVRIAAEMVDVGGGRQASVLRIVPVQPQHMRERFTRAVDLRRYDKRQGKWLSCDCPVDFAEAYLERFGWWRTPRLRAVTTAPALRPDGTILDRPGYDKRSQIYYDPRGVAFPPVPRAPTRDDALAALDLLRSTLLPTFDFADDASRSVALSAMFTALLRHAMSAAPLHAFSAPVPGSGKSKLVNFAAILRTGHQAPVTALGERDEETEKRLGAALIGGDAIIALDNIDRPLGGQLIDQLVTEPIVSARVLGKSLNLQVPNVYCLFATGNNLKLLGDMVRRALMCRLDPHCERPELREFETPDPVLIAAAQRPALVIAILTIARAFLLAGCPNDYPPLGSFAEWSRWVRDPLVWLGEADPVATIERVRHEDPRLNTLRAVLQQWHTILGEQEVSARQAAERAMQMEELRNVRAHPEFHEALLAVAGDRRGGISSQRLGIWLGTVKGRVVDGLQVDASPVLHGIARWRVTGSG